MTIRYNIDDLETYRQCAQDKWEYLYHNSPDLRKRYTSPFEAWLDRWMVQITMKRG